MPFHDINQTSGKFGRNLARISTGLVDVKDSIDLELSRCNEMSDAQFQTAYGVSTLTRAQMITTLTNAQTQLNHSSIINLETQVG